MLNRLDVLKCGPKGLVVEIIEGDDCSLACCGEPMTQLVENTVDASLEKHVPVAERSGSTLKIKVGSVPHPMLPEHHITFIEVITDGKCLQRRYLKPGDAPEATFTATDGSIVVREHCNLHGLWKAE